MLDVDEIEARLVRITEAEVIRALKRLESMSVWALELRTSLESDAARVELHPAPDLGPSRAQIDDAHQRLFEAVVAGANAYVDNARSAAWVHWLGFAERETGLGRYPGAYTVNTALLTDVSTLAQVLYMPVGWCCAADTLEWAGTLTPHPAFMLRDPLGKVLRLRT